MMRRNSQIRSAVEGMEEMRLPLEGLMVLDLTNVLAGPYCAMALGDMGADVIKIESFPDGDTSRQFEPKINGESYCFAVLNRNKRSLALDLKEPQGKQIFMRLARKADIIIENFRPGVVAKLGIDYDSVKAINPAVIYASLSGFGQTGPYRNRGGYDIVAQGMSGIMMMTGHPGQPPAKVGIAMNDMASGVTALYGILGAYIGKMRTARGQYLETSLLEAGLAWTPWEFGAFFGAGELPTAIGTRHRRAAPYQAYRTRDSYVTVGANNDRLWKRFCTDVCDQPEWLDDHRFATQPARMKNIDALEEAIQKVFHEKDTAHWVALLDAAGVPGGPVYGYEEILGDPQITARQMVVEIDHPQIGRMKTLGLPIKSSGALVEIRASAPWLGQHTEDVLRESGYEADEVEDMFSSRIIYDRRRTDASARGIKLSTPSRS